MSDNMNFDLVEKRNSIKNRLQKVFILISLGIIAVMSTFSVVYFYFSSKKEAASLIRNKIQLAEIFLENEKNLTFDFAKRLAEDNALMIGLDMNSTRGLSNYLVDELEKNPEFYVTLFDASGKIICDVGKSKSAVFTNRKGISASESVLLTESLAGSSCIDTINIQNGLHELFPCFCSSVPVIRNEQIIGVVMVRFVFSDNIDFFIQRSKDINADIAIYVETEPVVKTTSMEISSERYNEVARLKIVQEDISFTGDGLNEYRILKDNKDGVIGVLHVYISSLPYLKVFITIVLIYLLVAVIVISFVSIIVVKISESILKPLKTLLIGVHNFKNGNYEHEVELFMNDEIGKLGEAFNELSNELSNKITTIQTMNSSLEQTITERTGQINDINEKMKHYLSPQLYASIIGGDRDASTNQHYRKKLTVFFSDVKNFTATTDSLEPEDISSLLNSYLDRMAQIAEKYEGTIDKYVGDAVMVFFGDPKFTSDKDHALRAVKMAMEMQHSMIEFRNMWKHKGIQNPFHVRMGINTGYCTIGNFGSEMKMDYTIIGNNVNLAARYEASCEPDSVLISEDTYMLVKDEIECKVAGKFNMKGIPKPVVGYTPVRILDKQNNKKLIEISDNKELIMSSDSVDIKRLTVAEKRSLLLNLREAFCAIADKGDKSSGDSKDSAK